jgi:hypothetical protein
VLLRSLECREVSHKRAQRSASAFCFRPPVGQFSLSDFSQIATIVEAGYPHAREAMATVPMHVRRYDQSLASKGLAGPRG